MHQVHRVFLEIPSLASLCNKYNSSGTFDGNSSAVRFDTGIVKDVVNFHSIFINVTREF